MNKAVNYGTILRTNDATSHYVSWEMNDDVNPDAIRERNDSLVITPPKE